eukprot:4176677-Pyramimonas_sp.AAC.1
MATFTWWTIQGSPRAAARAHARRALLLRMNTPESHVNLEIQSGAAKGSLELPSQDEDFPTVGKTKYHHAPTRAHARRTLLLCPIDEQ